MSKKILFFTDIHWGIHTNSQKYLDICEKTMSWIKTVCIEKGIDTIVFGGDYFDSRSSIDVSTMTMATNSLYDLSESVKNIILVLGNHDIYLKESSDINSLCAYNGHTKIHVAEKPIMIGTHVLLLPWSYGKNDCDFNGINIEGVRTVFSHHDFPAKFFMGSKRISKSGNGDSSDIDDNSYDISPKLIACLQKNNGLFVSGHIHHKKEIPLKNSNMLIAGSPYETEYGFKDSKCGCYVIDTDTGTYEFIENPFNIKHIEFHTSSFSEEDISLAKNSFVRLIVDTNETNVRKSEFMTAIMDNMPYHVDNSVFDFSCASFVGQRDCSDNPLESMSDNTMSKLDYLNKLLDDSDFSAFSYADSNNEIQTVDKTIIKKMMEDYYSKVVK